MLYLKKKNLAHLGHFLNSPDHFEIRAAILPSFIFSLSFSSLIIDTLEQPAPMLPAPTRLSRPASYPRQMAVMCPVLSGTPSFPSSPLLKLGCRWYRRKREARRSWMTKSQVRILTRIRWSKNLSPFPPVNTKKIM